MALHGRVDDRWVGDERQMVEIGVAGSKGRRCLGISDNRN